MRLLIEGCAVLDPEAPSALRQAQHIAVDGNRIESIGEDRPTGPFDRVLPGRKRLAIPGLINAHTHSAENFLRATTDRMGLEPWLGLAVLLSWILTAVFFRYSSLSAIVAAVFAPFFYLFGDGVAWDAVAPVALAIAVMGLLLLWRHAENIQRLIAGKETKIGAKKK